MTSQFFLWGGSPNINKNYVCPTGRHFNKKPGCAIAQHTKFYSRAPPGIRPGSARVLPHISHKLKLLCVWTVLLHVHFEMLVRFSVRFLGKSNVQVSQVESPAFNNCVKCPVEYSIHVYLSLTWGLWENVFSEDLVVPWKSSWSRSLAWLSTQRRIYLFIHVVHGGVSASKVVCSCHSCWRLLVDANLAMRRIRADPSGKIANRIVSRESAKPMLSEISTRRIQLDSTT